MSTEANQHNKTKRPSFQFYPGDWLKDPGIASCSLAAQGLWIRMLCWMHECPTYGHLKVGGKVILKVNLSVMTGVPIDQLSPLLDELREAYLFSEMPDGTMYCRRMVRDEEIRVKRSAGGRLGGNPNLRSGAKVNHKVNHKVNLEVGPKVEQRDNLPPTPSSSSSSSDEEEERESLSDTQRAGDSNPVADVELPPGFPKTEGQACESARMLGIPDDFAISTWNLGMSRCGQDSKGIAIRSWIHHLKAAWHFHGQRTSEEEKRQQGVKAAESGLTKGWAKFRPGETMEEWGKRYRRMANS